MSDPLQPSKAASKPYFGDASTPSVALEVW